MLLLIYMYFICLLQLPRSSIYYFCLFPNLQINTSIVVRLHSQRPPVPDDFTRIAYKQLMRTYTPWMNVYAELWWLLLRDWRRMAGWVLTVCMGWR
ncbi:hypothetical protein M430DRAFT_236808 [Amorphotheca resinae ATCC 22711]|uniref:Uncharacterized protein n=1 Tax=Amorphotheca resinae ATCC 22711 TaxID=857342 RepID=A0A2T3B4V1_AMORE|nr:hypothetical protein M430DRAFT_236808 [Amorphotheca resinae ATCC 22711]PSS20666.1 hypothetical protein M430DRAFT_236808 [Amorphotheca resinae ATCC 22711]